MIRTDGRPTIAMRESEPLIPGQMAVDECIAIAEADTLTLAQVQREESCEEKHERTARNAWGIPEPLLGGHN